MDLSDVLKKYILENENTSTNKLYKDLRKGRNLNITKQSIERFKESLQEKIEQKSRNSMNRKVVFPYLGGWFFDLLINRNLYDKYDKEESKKNDEYNPNFQVVPYWAAFCHGNSGYIIIYPCHSKSHNTLDEIAQDFVHKCKHLPVIVRGSAQYINYPVKVIVSDMESGFHPSIPGVKILRYNAGENHRFHARINSFMSRCRDDKRNKEKSSSNKSQYLEPEDIEEFVIKWNSEYLSFTQCTRGEILADKDLELAYIAKSLYINDYKDKMANDYLDDDDLISIRQTEKNAWSGGTPLGQILPGKYRVVDKVGRGLTVENIFDKSDKRNIHFNDIKSVQRKGKSIREKLREELKDVRDPYFDDLFGLNLVHVGRKPRQVKELTNENIGDISKEIYMNNQQRWEDRGFPGEYRSEQMYKGEQKIEKELDNHKDRQNKILANPQRRRMDKRSRERAREAIDTFLDTNRWDFDPGLSEAVNHSERMLTRRRYKAIS